MRFDQFVGLSYVDCGRSLGGVDCYGLLWLVYRETLGIELPSHDARYANAADRAAAAALIAGELDPWAKIEDGTERAFDAVLMRIGRDVMHIGLVTEPGKVLHIERGDTSRIEPYRGGRLRHRLSGFYRYRGK